MLKTICRIAVVILTVTYVASPFHSFDLRLWTFFNALVILTCAVPLMGGAFRRSALSFFVIGLALLLYAQQPFAEWVAGVISMLNIVAILVIMQMFSIPITIGNYSVALEALLIRQFSREASLFLFVTVSTHVFASFLLFGTIPVMLSLFGDLLKRNTADYKRFAATALSRGYSLVVLWAPGGVNILLVLQTTGADWVDVFLPGLAFSIIGVLLSLMVEYRNLSGAEQPPSPAAPADNTVTLRSAWIKLADVLTVVAGLIIAILLLERAGFASSNTRVLFSGLMVVVLWLMRLYKQPGFRSGFFDYWENGLLKTIDLAVLFICMGLFSRGVALSGVWEFTQPYLILVINQLGYSYLLAGLPILIVISAVLGLHPFVSMVIIGKTVMSLGLDEPVVPLALALSFGGAVSYVVSPFAGIVLTLAQFLDSKPADIALRWNGIFSVILLGAGMVYIVLLNWSYKNLSW